MDKEEEKEKEAVKGFAGLSSMASDVDAVVDSSPKKTQKISSDTAPKKSADNRPQNKQAQPGVDPWTDQRTTQPSGGSSTGKWLLGIVVVIGLLWIANQSDNNRSSTPASSPESSSTSVASASHPAPVKSRVASPPSESKPSVGRNNVLSAAQIRYCLAEKIRLDAAETVINNYIDSEVERFNGYVRDYNSRCGEFRYRQGALESAQREVDPYHSQLQAEGRSRFTRSPSISEGAPASTPASTPASKPSRPTPDGTVLAIQRRLNDLGYDAGSVDGLMGKKTLTAILEFQKELGVTSDGVASNALLAQLNSTTSMFHQSGDTKSNPGATAGQAVGVQPQANYQNDTSSDRENYDKCIDGRYPALCKHSLLSSSEAVRVDAAERKANLKKCIDGRYPALCDHSLLAQSEAVLVDAAERKANFDKCIDGRYPALCDHSLLDQSEAVRVGAAEREANFEKCIDGRYPALCDHSLLDQSEFARVDAAERKANFDKCIDGRYPALCDHGRLSSQESLLVQAAESRAGSGN